MHGCLAAALARGAGLRSVGLIAGQCTPGGLTTAGSIVFSSSVTTEPQSAAFCQNGGTLQLSGENGTDLFGAQGLRSAQFTRM